MAHIIGKTLIDKAERLSSEWDNTGFIVKNSDGSLEATVWNHWKWEESKRPVIACVNGVDGWQVKDSKYQLQK